MRAYLLCCLLAVQFIPCQASGGEKITDSFGQLASTEAHQSIQPTKEAEITQAVASFNGKISIGGACYSMGGQTALENPLHIDMRRYNKVTGFSLADKTISVQSGISWREVQQYIDPYNLSVSIMQTYANFTVGGSLSVNVHGRYVGATPIIGSVKSIKLILANGETVVASPIQQAELFYGAIGGYGALGIISEATLQLTDNIKIQRFDKTMPLDSYKSYFFNRIQQDKSAIFHNATIYPDNYNTVRAITFRSTQAPLTIQQRLQPLDADYRKQQLLLELVTHGKLGKKLRQSVIDPLRYRGNPVVWRNYEASYNTDEIKPKDTDKAVYVLQEYFIPVDQFESFYPQLIAILKKHDVNVLNISIRHALKDPGSLLAWARQDVFSFVIFYEQLKKEGENDKVRLWTQQLIDAALACNGTFYLPYQIHATQAQFLKGYPNAAEFFKLKKQVDPDNKFSNKLWQSYYPQS